MSEDQDFFDSHDTSLEARYGEVQYKLLFVGFNFSALAAFRDSCAFNDMIRRFIWLSEEEENLKHSICGKPELQRSLYYSPRICDASLGQYTGLRVMVPIRHDIDDEDYVRIEFAKRVINKALNRLVKLVADAMAQRGGVAPVVEE